MRWKGRRVSDNVEDRRGGGGAKAGGISIIGLIVAFVAWKFFGVDPQQAYQATKQVTSSGATQGAAPANLTAEQKEVSDFVGTILADTEDTWTPILKAKGVQYVSPKLVMFSGAIQSGCGAAQSAMDPFIVQQIKKYILIPSSLKICVNRWASLVSRIKQSFLQEMKQVILRKLM